MQNRRRSACPQERAYERSWRLTKPSTRTSLRGDRHRVVSLGSPQPILGRPNGRVNVARAPSPCLCSVSTGYLWTATLTFGPVAYRQPRRFRPRRNKDIGRSCVSPLHKSQTAATTTSATNRIAQRRSAHPRLRTPVRLDRARTATYTTIDRVRVADSLRLVDSGSSRTLMPSDVAYALDCLHGKQGQDFRWSSIHPARYRAARGYRVRRSLSISPRPLDELA